MTEEHFIQFKAWVNSVLQLKEDGSAATLSMNIPNIYQTVLDIYTSELMILKNLQAKSDKKFGEMIKYYKETYKVSLSTKEVEGYINSNDEYHALVVNVYNTQCVVNYLEQTLDNIKKLSFNIKNWIEIKKFYEGA